jgi:prepilin-type N-terminal cleavage/methylation domain-containing protein/prepilin-type processing-associated H-X9-DG protein
MKQRRAFTLIELLVVIAIIAVLIGLLLPAVQKVRETANRLTCTNNLKQIALAYHNYHDSHDGFPFSASNSMTAPAGWGIYILPYLEQDPLYRSYNLAAPFFYTNMSQGIDNQKVVNTPLKMMQCPTAPPDHSYRNYSLPPPFNFVSWSGSSADYGPEIGVDPNFLAPYLMLPSGENLDGVLQPDKSIRIRDITDGTSNTLLICEIAGRPNVWQAGHEGSGVTYFSGAGGWGDATSGNARLYGSSYDGTMFPGTCGINCSNDFGLYAFHLGGANVAFADGSVHFLNATIDIRTLVALITRAGGEPGPTGY